MKCQQQGLHEDYSRQSMTSNWLERGSRPPDSHGRSLYGSPSPDIDISLHLSHSIGLEQLTAGQSGKKGQRAELSGD